MRELILIRHGQSTNNLLWQETGTDRGRDSDPLLTDSGTRQAAATAAAFAADHFGITPTHLYTSLMTRAVQTAAPIADALDLDLVAHPDVYEVAGIFGADPETGDPVAVAGAGRVGLSEVSARLVWPEQHDEDGWWSGLPDDPWQDAAERAKRVVAGLDERHGDDDVVAIVSHGAFTQCLLRELLGIEAMTGWFEVLNCAVTRVRLSEYGNWVLTWLARVDHLAPGLHTE